jgi:hypothetical protein
LVKTRRAKARNVVVEPRNLEPSALEGSPPDELPRRQTEPKAVLLEPPLLDAILVRDVKLSRRRIEPKAISLEPPLLGAIPVIQPDTNPVAAAESPDSGTTMSTLYI